MVEQPISTLAFARELSNFQDYLEHVEGGGGGGVNHCPDAEVAAALASTLLTLITGLADDQRPVPAIAEAIRAHGEAQRAHSERMHYERQSMDDWLRRKAAEEEINRTVECPYCGASPETKCRTSGAVSGIRHIREHSHRDRYRLARSLNDGAPKAEADRG